MYAATSSAEHGSPVLATYRSRSRASSAAVA